MFPLVTTTHQKSLIALKQPQLFKRKNGAKNAICTFVMNWVNPRVKKWWETIRGRQEAQVVNKYQEESIVEKHLV